MESNLGLRGKRPATNRVKYGTASSFIIIIVVVVVVVLAVDFSIWLLLELIINCQ